VIIRRAFKYKLKPTPSQREKFLQFAGARRFVFNRGLDQRKKAYDSARKTPSYFEQNVELTALKDQSETSWLKEIHSQILQQALKDLDRAFQNFFRRVKQDKLGYPRFKKKGISESFRYPQGVKVSGSQVYLPKIGWIKFRKSRELQGTLNETTILQEGTNWFVSFSCEWEKEIKPAPLDENQAIGIDMGLTKFATTSSSSSNSRQDIENPPILEQTPFTPPLPIQTAL